MINFIHSRSFHFYYIWEYQFSNFLIAFSIENLKLRDFIFFRFSEKNWHLEKWNRIHHQKTHNAVNSILFQLLLGVDGMFVLLHYVLYWRLEDEIFHHRLPKRRHTWRLETVFNFNFYNSLCTYYFFRNNTISSDNIQHGKSTVWQKEVKEKEIGASPEHLKIQINVWNVSRNSGKRGNGKSADGIKKHFNLMWHLNRISQQFMMSLVSGEGEMVTLEVIKVFRNESD